jgi:hypothetical protein
MNSHRVTLAVSVMLLGLAAALSGCGNVFTAKHKVLVDAISLPDAPKPSGQSYRLLAKRSVISQTPVEVPVVKACVDAALSGQGMFEAAPNIPSDIFIEVSFGRDATPRVDPAARETFLQLSARANPDRRLDKPTGPELWDVRVAVLGVSGRVESAMPLLSSVAATYVATNTNVETRIDVPQNSPAIAAVRENALRILEGKGPATPPGSAAPSGPGAAVVTPK